MIEEGIEDYQESFDDNIQSFESEELASSESLISDPEESYDSSGSPEEIEGSGAVEEGIEEGEEIPDIIDESEEFVESAQIDESVVSGSSSAETEIKDYTEQLAQISENLENLDSEIELEDLQESLISIDTNIETLHKDMYQISKNENLGFQLEVGLLVAIWATIIIYIAFSKIF